MKYFETLLEEQETLINVLYDEHKIRVYSNRIEVIKNLTKSIGKPTKRYKKNNTYWSGATWEIDFNEFEKINIWLNRNLVIEETFDEKRKESVKPKTKTKVKIQKGENYQINLDF